MANPMTLLEAVRTVIREVAETDLRKIVREVLLEELMGESPRTTAAKKAAVTRAANRESNPGVRAKPRQVIPKRAKALGLALGQQYRGKKYNAKIRDRVIEIVKMDDKFIYPKIIGSAGKNAKAKKIAYDSLLSRYDRVK